MTISQQLTHFPFQTSELVDAACCYLLESESIDSTGHLFPQVLHCKQCTSSIADRYWTWVADRPHCYIYRFSIHAHEQASHREAVLATMPMPVAGCPDVYHCGFSSKDSFGSTAYLIVRSAGNILVDSPRFDRHLLNQIQVIQSFLVSKALHDC